MCVCVCTCIRTHSGYGSRCYDPSALAYRVCKSLFLFSALGVLCMSSIYCDRKFTSDVCAFNVWLYCVIAALSTLVRLIPNENKIKFTMTMEAAVAAATHSEKETHTYGLSMSNNYLAEWIASKKRYEKSKIFRWHCSRSNWETELIYLIYLMWK